MSKDTYWEELMERYGAMPQEEFLRIVNEVDKKNAFALATLATPQPNEGNYMPQVAKILGKRIGEVFYIYSENKLLRAYHTRTKCKFTETDLLWFDESVGRWQPLKGSFYDLMTGVAKIVE